jgi:hypothetical protein
MKKPDFKKWKLENVSAKPNSSNYKLKIMKEKTIN